ncbi:MAG: hypothetical protein ACI8QS_000002 [Planctomycetota bacterium]
MLADRGRALGFKLVDGASLVLALTSLVEVPERDKVVVLRGELAVAPDTR